MNDGHSHLATMAGRMTTSSAMNPGLLFCLMVTPVSIVASGSLFHFGHWMAGSGFAAIAAIPVAIVSWQLVRFTLKEPDRLQKDEHLQRMFELKNSVAIKDHGELVQIPVSSTLSQNPALEDKSDGKIGNE